MMRRFISFFFFFFNDTATTEIYTLSLHDALPIYWTEVGRKLGIGENECVCNRYRLTHSKQYLAERSEEHTSELQSHVNLVCRLLLEKKKKTIRSRQNR